MALLFPLFFVMVSWMHNTTTNINDISKEYNHRGTQRVDLKTLCFSVVKSGGFYRLCGIDLTTTDSADFIHKLLEHVLAAAVLRCSTECSDRRLCQHTIFTQKRYFSVSADASGVSSNMPSA